MKRRWMISVRGWKRRALDRSEWKCLGCGQDPKWAVELLAAVLLSSSSSSSSTSNSISSCSSCSSNRVSVAAVVVAVVVEALV
jgi:hypothetical protein